jgi:hypothetical protein
MRILWLDTAASVKNVSLIMTLKSVRGQNALTKAGVQLKDEGQYHCFLEKGHESLNEHKQTGLRFAIS